MPMPSDSLPGGVIELRYSISIRLLATNLCNVGS